jgi:hypothetical protein
LACGNGAWDKQSVLEVKSSPMRELALLEVEPGVNQAEVKAESLRQQLKLDLRKPRKFVKFASRCSIQPATAF